MSTAQGHALEQTAQATAEMAWNFERPPPAETAEEVWLTKLKFWLDGRIQKLMENRSADPDAPITRDDIERMVRESARMGAIYGMQSSGGYTEAPKPDSTLKAVVIGCTVTLLCAFVLGAWTLSTQMSAFHEWQVATEKRIDHLEALRQ